MLVTGVVATTVAAPFDTLKSRVMASGSALGVGGAARELFAREGARALFRGWLPCYFRLGPHAILTFPLLEQMRRALGLENL